MNIKVLKKESYVNFKISVVYYLSFLFTLIKLMVQHTTKLLNTYTQKWEFVVLNKDVFV